MSRRLPRIVHQIWMQGWDHLPAPFTDYAADLRRMNPEFEFRTWDDTQLRAECAELGPIFLACYDRFPKMISKVDFGRYVLLYKYGGLSLDTDMKPLRPLREAAIDPTATLVVSEAAHSALYANNAVMWVTPHHSLLLKLLHTIIADTRRPEDFGSILEYVMETTGPMMFGRWAYKHRDHIYLAPHHMFEPCFSKDPWCRPDDRAILDHRHENSWNTSPTQLLELAYFAFLDHSLPALIACAAIVTISLWSKKPARR